VIGWKKGRGDKEQKGRTRNQANVSGSRMSMTLLRLSFDSPLRASDGEKGQIHLHRHGVRSFEHTL
jgi:hypothetical protein